MRLRTFVVISITLMAAVLVGGYVYAEHLDNHYPTEHCQVVTTKDTNQYSPTYGDSFTKWVCKKF